MKLPITGKNIDSRVLNDWITILLNDSKSPESLKFRKEFFNPKQSIYNIRLWFNKCPGLQLTSEELENIKNVIVKPSSSDVFIINSIIAHQISFNNDDIEKWVSYVRKLDIRVIAMTVILKETVTNLDLKLELAQKLLTHINFVGMVFDKMGLLLANDSTGIWNKIFNLIVDMINKEDMYSESIANNWIHSKQVAFFDLYASHRDIESRLLYEKTGKIQYLSKEAQNVFIF